jgi:hypothetical protein
LPYSFSLFQFSFIQSLKNKGKKKKQTFFIGIKVGAYERSHKSTTKHNLVRNLIGPTK